MWFWFPAIALAGLVALMMLVALLRTRSNKPDKISDVQVYRDQLRAVEKDVERGTVTPEDAERIRIEVSRRLLAADKMQQKMKAMGNAPPAATFVAAGVVALLLVGGTIGLYYRLGAPGYEDEPLAKRIAAANEARASRASQAEVEAKLPPAQPMQQIDAKYQDLMQKLRQAVANNPDELRGQQLLARNEANIGNFNSAYTAQKRVIELKGTKATAGDYAEYANLLILAAQGYVSPEAEAALGKALKLDPKNGTALYFTGLMFAQTGRYDIAFNIWRDLLDSSPPDAPWINPIRNQIPGLAQMAGVRYTLPPEPGKAPGRGLNGPSAADVAAAQNMSDEERQNMIRSMVSRLSERLNSEGGTPAEWARLIGAYGVLGEKDLAAKAWARARQEFDGKAEELAAIRDAANRAGVTE